MFIDLDRVRASRTVRSLLMQARSEALAANTHELLGSIDAALRALAAEETAHIPTDAPTGAPTGTPTGATKLEPS